LESENAYDNEEYWVINDNSEKGGTAVGGKSEGCSKDLI
jgi:hypothetical protein